MKRSEAARYARWSATVALLLAGITVAVYLQRGVARHIETKKAPPAAPSDVTRLSSGLTFSKVEQNRTIFTVQASKSTEFKDQDASILEDVRITIFGKTGERHDTIHTQSCRYGKENGDVLCSGAVQIDLQSATDAERSEQHSQEPAAQAVHIETQGVTFDRASGEAHTDQKVSFTFPGGRGEGRGVEYNAEEGVVRLQRDVRLVLTFLSEKHRPQNATADAVTEVQAKGTRLDFGRDTRRLHLSGPAEVETQNQKLTAGELTLLLDATFHAERLTATAGAYGEAPYLTSQNGSGSMEMTADNLTAAFAGGWVKTVETEGNVHGSRKSEGEDDAFRSDTALLELWPRQNRAKNLSLSGGVNLQTRLRRTGEARALQTAAFHMEFGGENEPSKPQRAETLARGTLEWVEPATQTGQQASTKLQADRLALDFDAEGKPRELQANANVQTERTMPGRTTQTATAQSGTVQLLAAGGWSQMDLERNVKLKEGARTAQAEHAAFDRKQQTATLTGDPVVRDTTTETRASRITFAQATGDIHADGNVRSTDFSAQNSAVQLAPLPLNITSDQLQGNSKTGRALYSRHARMWQGDSVMEADSIELLRSARVLKARGRVRAVFPQVNTTRVAQANATVPSSPKSQLWHASADTLTYEDAENRAHLERNVIVQSAEQRIRAVALDLYFTPGGSPAPNAASASSGARQIQGAVGTGGVVVDQGLRRATAERGEYTAADGKFVMSGGNPTLYDGSAGTTTGRQLTFFLADDTIIVDSETGSRTLTKHRVEK